MATGIAIVGCTGLVLIVSILSLIWTGIVTVKRWITK